MSAKSSLIGIILVLAVGCATPVSAMAADGFAALSADHWSHQAMQILSRAGLTADLPNQQEGLNRYEIALMVGEVVASVENTLRRDGFRDSERLTPQVVTDAMRQVTLENSGFITDNVLLAFSDLRTEFEPELSLLGMQGELLNNFSPVAVDVVRAGEPATGEVVTGGTNSEEWDAQTEFRPQYNLTFNTSVSDDVWAIAEVSGDFSHLLSNNEVGPRTTPRGLTPLELERIELYINKETLSARVSNRLYTTLDRYTLYDQELVGAEAEMIVGNLGTTVIFGESPDSTMIAALNGQYRLNPHFEVGGTIVSADRGQDLQSTNYGINGIVRVAPGLEFGGQYYKNGQASGGTALELTAWSQLAGINLTADFTRVDVEYSSPLAPWSSDTYIPGSRGYKLSADTSVGRVGLAAEYGVHDYELASEQAVTRELSASLPLVPERLAVEAEYRLVDVDALYSPDYSTSTVNIGSDFKLTDQITLKAGYEVSQDSNENSYRSVNADVNVGLTEKAELNADVVFGKESGLGRTTHKEAGIELGYNFNEYAHLTANYRLINFDSAQDTEDFTANRASAELKLNF